MVALVRIADGLDMADHARICLGLAPCQMSTRHEVGLTVNGDGLDQGTGLLRQTATVRNIDASLMQVLQDETNAIRLLNRRLGAPAVAAKLGAHISGTTDHWRAINARELPIVERQPARSAGREWDYGRIDCRSSPVAVTIQKYQPLRLPDPGRPLALFTALMTSPAAGLGLRPVALGAEPEIMSIRPVLGW